MTNKTKEFLQKLKDSGHWNDDYDYSKVEFVNYKTKIKIICPSHGEFEQRPDKTLLGNKCLNCVVGNRRYTKEEFVQKAVQIHSNKYDYSLVEYVKSSTKVKIVCPTHGEFEQTPSGHLTGSGCPKCSTLKNADKRRLSTEEFIQKAKKVHGEKYDYSKTNYINNNTNIIIIDGDGFEHSQNPTIHLKGCVLSSHSIIDKTANFIRRAKEVHGNKYDYSKVEYIDSDTNVKIICPEHGEFEQKPSNHLYGKRCAKCSGVYKMDSVEFIGLCKEKYGDEFVFDKTKFINIRTKVIVSDKYGNDYGVIPFDFLRGRKPTLRSALNKNIIFIERAKIIHNDKYDYSSVEYEQRSKKIKITCPEHGEFEQTPNSHLNGHGCPKCSGSFMNTEYFIKKSKEVHGDKYDYSLVDYKNNKTKVKIICPEHGEFKQVSTSHLTGSGCPICNNGFNKEFKIKLIRNLSNSDLLTMDPVELQIIIQQGKLPSDFRPLVNTEAESDERIATLRELRERFESEEDITTENVIDDVEQTPTLESEEVTDDDIDEEITTTTVERRPRLPIVNQIQDLHSLDNVIYTGMDEEAFQSLIQYKLRKIWNSLLNNDVDIETLRAEEGGKYFTLIKEEFLSEYEAVLLVEPSEGYNFKDRNGNIAQPNLMQKLTVFRLLKNKYYGNWSGTGAGKTLSFILASRNMGAKLTLVIALNSTIEQTCKSIKQVYPNSKCFTEYQEGHVFDRNEYNYLVLNYEKFQQENSERLFQSLTNNNQIDFIVIDEVHNAKQREEDNESIRRAVMTRLLGRARENDNLHVLAMSATPVINNLFEAKSLLQLMSGLEYEDLQTKRTIGNALNIFQQLTLNGLRFIPKYDISISELTGRNMSNLNIDGSHLLERLLRLTPNDYIGVEKLILDDKLQAITPYLRKGVIIYSYFTTGIISKIQKYVEVLGFKVGTYTGEESTVLRTQNLKDFIGGKIDIIIGSRPIGTGVDGLQDVSNRMICLTLPWTDSEYTQLKGRIYRQGSLFNEMEIIIPQVKIQLEGDDVWSWDIQRLNLIKNKRTLADAAVDGVIPSNVIPSPETLFRKSIESLKNWQDRVASGNVISTNRRLIQVDLYPEVDNENERERRVISELSEFNRRGKTTHSETIHKEFVDNPDSWFRYHALRKSRMKLGVIQILQ